MQTPSAAMIADSYSLDDHRKRFSSWAAVTAARASKKCRFTRTQGILLVSKSGLSKIGVSWDDLPKASEFDEFHRQLRCDLCKSADKFWDSTSHGFGHGVAAKLINVYLKAIYLSGIDLNHAPEALREKANALHPPLDRLLLAELALKDVGGQRQFWKRKMSKGWSNFTSADYESTIHVIRDVTDGALWKIEKHWLGPTE
ncbi:hypothetical protein [Rhizobium leguminosarum]|uniref:hypothetical protein n=1 Tax=Rhizobium leguminosarum TaxID=384 RepID=UPI001C97FD87|nr:hypothetical protein [Rhizobium leguminosarum]MBY5558958.1 hypothetical protein [Rhizobium leguminosarum]